ncbi:hypothetical protein [Vibrio fluminensis]|uniref:hypothetical protein n=1 Tax=Vibrio fluminensis TaxID=2783614 RepID=UPI001888B16C|nr:hypothetical protein [Vibrio fluminensis]
MHITSHKIAKRSLLKILVVGLGLSFFIVFLIAGIAATLGRETVLWDNEVITGFRGLLLALAIWPIFSFIFALFIWVWLSLGLWIYSFISPIKIVFKDSARLR